MELVIFLSVYLIALSIIFSWKIKRYSTPKEYHTAGGSISPISSAISVAASWAWAPAIFVSALKAHNMGPSGLFWFILPNVFALLIFMWIAPRFRKQCSGGFSFLHWIDTRSSSQVLKTLYRVPIYWYQIMAIVVQILVGSMFLSKITGLSSEIIMIFMLVICGFYSAVGGIRASVNTDVLQFGIMIVGSVFILSYLFINDPNNIVSNYDFGAAFLDIADMNTALFFGVVSSFGLIGGALIDQQIWQRTLITNPDNLKKTFLYAGFIFALVPLCMGTLGLLAINDEMIPDQMNASFGPEFVGYLVVKNNIGVAAGGLFTLLIVAGLMSTLDSAICAFSALREGNKSHTNDYHRLRNTFLFCLFAYVITKYVFSGVPLDRVWWILNGVAVAFISPTLYFIFRTKKVCDRILTISIIFSLIPLASYMYFNYVGNDLGVLMSCLAVFFVTLIGVGCNHLSARDASNLASRRATFQIDSTTR